MGNQNPYGMREGRGITHLLLELVVLWWVEGFTVDHILHHGSEYEPMYLWTNLTPFKDDLMLAHVYRECMIVVFIVFIFY